MDAYKQHHAAAADAMSAHSRGDAVVVEVLGCMWSVRTVDATRDGNEWGPPRLTLEPVIGFPVTMSTNQVEQSLKLKDDGLWANFQLNGKCFTFNLDDISPARFFTNEYRRVKALQAEFHTGGPVEPLKAAFLKGPTIADLIDQGYLQPLDPRRVRPTKTPAPWNGEGLPPVGCECEVCWDSGERTYVGCKVLAHDEDRAVFRFTSGPRKGEYGSGDAEPCEIARDVPAFRTIRTAEQLAAEAREKAIDELVSRFAINGSNVKWRELFAQMHDAGVFKPDA